MSAVSEKTFEKIRADHLRPRARWTFAVRTAALFLGPVLATAVAGAALSAAVYWSVDKRLLAVRAADGWLWPEDLLLRLPYFWMLSAALAIVVAYVTFRLTDRGYRYRMAAVFVTAFFGAVAFAGVFHLLGMDAALNTMPSPSAPALAPIAEERGGWSRPEEGWLGGRVTGLDEEGFVLESFDKKFWYVKPVDAVPGREFVRFTAELRVDGRVTGDGTFEATAVSPWVPPQE